MAKRFAPVTSTEPTTSIEDGWRHELYTKFCKAKTKGRGVAFWWPIWQPIVFEQCVVEGNAVWQKNFLRPVDTLVHVPDCTLLMHSATQSVRLGYTGAAQDATDVYCICGKCGSMCSGPREWVRFDLSVVSSWPTLGLQSFRVYRPTKRRKGAKARKEVDRPRGPLFVPPSVEIVADPNPIDSNASFQSEVADAPSRFQPPRAAKLRRVAIVEASDCGQASSSSTDSSSNSGSSSSSDSDSGGASDGSVASRDSSACTSSAVEVSGVDSTRSTEVEAAPAPPPPKKKFRRSAVCGTQPAVSATIDLGAESSPAPPPHLLSEGDFFPTDTEVALRIKMES